jgi:hypothetical protein
VFQGSARWRRHASDAADMPAVSSLEGCPLQWQSTDRFFLADIAKNAMSSPHEFQNSFLDRRNRLCGNRFAAAKTVEAFVGFDFDVDLVDGDAECFGQSFCHRA